jgi:hypothetical protein
MNPWGWALCASLIFLTKDKATRLSTQHEVTTMDEKPNDEPQSRAETFSDSPSPLRRVAGPIDGRSEVDIPSISKEAGRSVGLLAAEKEIKIARQWLFCIGLLYIGGAIYLWWPLQVPPDFGFVTAVASGTIYLLLGAFVLKWPMPCTILGLALFLSAPAARLLADPEAYLGQLMSIRIVVLLFFLWALINCIHAAKKYERERKAATNN